MTGSLWRSGFVAALLAIHPLHVESVAWISERKDVLSAVFFMLTLGRYTRYVHKPSLTSYLPVLLMFALGLKSKLMLVPLPFVILLLDYWPLSRIRAPEFAKGRGKSMIRSQWPIVSRLITERIPLLALSAVSSVLTWLTHLQSAGSKYQFPFTWRFNNAVVSYVAYLSQMFLPMRLAGVLPHPNGSLPLWQVFFGDSASNRSHLVGNPFEEATTVHFDRLVLVCGNARTVIGLVQADEQARADRYTYLPQIGLYLLIVWGVAEMTTPMITRGFAEVRRGRQRHGYKPFRAAVAAVLIIPLSWRGFAQTG